jgi:serralysin
MTGTNKTIKFVSATGNQLIDGVISAYAWGGTSITYAFPTTASSYSYTGEKNNNFAAISDAQKQAARFVLDKDVGNAANDGFSVEGFTNVSFSEGSASTATLRLAQSGKPPTAYAYYPFTNASGGDTWFGTAYNYRSPVAGNYAWHTLIHELGHALGLKHGHEIDESVALPSDKDSLEFSVMTYRTFVGDAADGYKYEKFGAPQTFMMADIAALQHMYGADFSTNSGNTVYKWTPGSGNTVVDGTVAIQPGANRIFATIWDGGGVDTFDLTAYTTGLKIDLRAGGFSMFSEDQLAYLRGGPNDGFARGNIFNALLYNGDTRSLIENVKGGAGNDSIRGNQLANSISGNGGNDTLNGDRGNDGLDGGSGNDTLIGGAGADKLSGSSGTDTASYATATIGIIADLADAMKNTNDAKGDTYSSIETLTGSNFSDQLYGNSGNNVLNGGTGNDLLIGRAGADKLFGGSGTDTASYATATIGVVVNFSTPSSNTNDAKGDSYSSVENLTGSNFSDRLYGDNSANTIDGLAGADLINGGGGNDRLYGASGADDLYGGTGADAFIFKSTSDTGSTLAAADTIFDFNATQGDKIDLSGIDANTKVSGNQAFSFVGTFTGASAQVRFEKAASDTYVYGDVNGDKKTDFMIHLDDAFTILGSYFIL